jgi:hypothetical protein
MAEQTYKNHAKFVPPYHYVAFPIFLVNALYLGYQAVRAPGLASAWAFVVAIALLLAVFYARIFALRVQDRVIRLEERARLGRLLPADLQGRVGEFTIDQLVALRFASDGEVAELAATVLRDGIRERDAIKKMVKVWRVDDARA